MKPLIEVRRYITRAGVDVVGSWLSDLRNRRARAKITARIGRLSFGNFGDCKALHEGVWELRIDEGPGYRLYYSMIGRTCVLLLCGGDKRKQESDIARAVECLIDYKERTSKP